MYPERRPYATAVTHSGYLSKPVLPPVDALRILNSAVGMDVPRSLRQEAAATSPPRPFSAGKALPSRGVQLWKPPTLESAIPFSFKEKEYHTSQQIALNAQLSNAIEELFKIWHRKVRDLLMYLNTYPAQCATSNTLTTDAMESFFQGYRSTDVLPMSEERLVQDFKLASTPEMLHAIQSAPELQRDRIRRTLDTLLNSHHFLAPLEHYVEELEPLAALALRDEPQEGNDGVAQGAVWLSKAAVSLHEKFHYDPSEYTMKELRKTDMPIERLERRVLETKEQKERAIDNELPGDALHYLTIQVDLSNDLLLMNKARLELVQLYTNDVRELKGLVDTIIDDARRSVELLRRRIDRDLPLVKKDLESLHQDIQNTGEHINYLEKDDQEAKAQARKDFSKIEDEEKDLWTLLIQTMQKLVKVSEEKDEFVKKQMRLREQRARDMALATELLKAQQKYYDRLRSCEESLWRWSDTAEVYEKYVEAYVPKLLKKVHDVEEARHTLYNNEAQDYVRRYEMFEYAVEEGRATRQVHVDRLKTHQRSLLLDVERAAATLDPHLEKYQKEMSERQVELDEAQAYIGLVEGLEQERRGEVEPILQHVISYNRTIQSQHAELEPMQETLQLRDKPASSTSTTRTAPDVDVNASASASATTTAAIASPLVATGATSVGVAAETAMVPHKTEQQEKEEREKENKGTSRELARGADGEPIVAVTDIQDSIGFASAPPLTGALRLRPTGTTTVVGTENSMLATVAHPHVQARTVGINHEEAFVEKFRRFAENEQHAVEGAAAKARQERQLVDKLSLKYDNADYLKMLYPAPERGNRPATALR
ncbi:Paraflagellar rod [Trypanosoma melophagium]|uniref:Paraflagellar rod n=1 Tax=Trypanosoma melophagium TaxID=715481 RepID=UPI003519D9B8|nr:Paraflagellar rod [Trypanosoma melophagium]